MYFPYWKLALKIPFEALSAKIKKISDIGSHFRTLALRAEINS
jgi:hypothetical protein